MLPSIVAHELQLSLHDYLRAAFPISTPYFRGDAHQGETPRIAAWPPAPRGGCIRLPTHWQPAAHPLRAIAVGFSEGRRGRSKRMSYARGEEHCSKRAGPGWPAPDLQAERDARA